jgi:hypothetical protein
MNREELLKKLNLMLDEFERGKIYGSIQIDIQSGRPDLIRKMMTQKISNEGNSQHEQYQPPRR